MSLCILAAGKLTTLAALSFSLSWTHSVEKVEWREQWLVLPAGQVTPAGLVLLEAAVKGSGAGMEPGEGARLRDGWWVWKPTLPARPELVLAASGATVSPWTLCAQGECREIGAVSGAPVVVRPCD